MIDFIFGLHIHWGKTLDTFENQQRSSLNMNKFYLITDFCIMVIPEAIFQAGTVKFASVGGLDTLIDMNSGFCDNRKILFLLNI